MEKIYTESMLKPMKKADLYEILLEKGIEVNKNTPNEEMIAMILANNSPDDEVEKDTDTQAKTPQNDSLPRYTPEQLIKSSTYSHRRDVLRTLLDDGKVYSHADIAAILKEFYERQVVV